MYSFAHAFKIFSNILQVISNFDDCTILINILLTLNKEIQHFQYTFVTEKSYATSKTSSRIADII